MIDVTDGPSSVEELSELDARDDLISSLQEGSYKPKTTSLCVTPCVIDLSVGRHALLFTLKGDPARVERVLLDVEPGTSVYRRALGKHEAANQKRPLGVFMMVAGVQLFLGGGGVALSRLGGDGESKAAPFVGVSAVGVVSLLLGTRLYSKAGPPAVQQEGAALSWSLSSGPESAPTKVAATDPNKAAPKLDPSKSAEELFTEAKTLYNLQDYEAALAGFQEVYKRTQEAELLINIGQCYRQLGKNTEALRSYQSFLFESPNSPLRPQIEQLINELKGVPANP